MHGSAAMVVMGGSGCRRRASGRIVPLTVALHFPSLWVNAILISSILAPALMALPKGTERSSGA